MITTRRLTADLGLTTWQMRLARENGLLPEPDAGDGRWSAALAAACAERVPKITATFGNQPPVGALKAAALLSARVGLDVERADVEVLVARDALKVVGHYQGHPLYLLRDLDALTTAALTEVVTARKGPLATTVDAIGAARVLAWPKAVFERLADHRGLTTDQLGRYSLAEVRDLSGDPDLIERVRDEERRTTLTKAKREETRHEEALRDWLRHCTAYLEHNEPHPPDPTQARRTLRALTTARSITTP